MIIDCDMVVKVDDVDIDVSLCRPALIAVIAEALLGVGDLPGIASFETLLRVDAATAATAQRHPKAGRARAEAEAALRALPQLRVDRA